MKDRFYISVILPLKLEWIPCYRTGENVEVGSRVRVAFAGKEYVGVVERTDVVPDIAAEKVKEVISIEKDMERVLAEEIELWKRVADYYLCTIGEVYKAAYPVSKINLEHARAEARKRVCQRRERTLAAIASKLEKLNERLEKKTAQVEKAKEGTKTRTTLLSDIEKIKGEILSGKAALEMAERNLKAAQNGLEVAETSEVTDNVSLSDAQHTAFEKIGEHPDIVIGCAGGGSNLGGLISPFMGEKLRGERDCRFIAVEPASCPSLTRGAYAYDYCDTGRICPLAKMYTIGADYIPSASHSGGLRFHGMSTVVSELYDQKLMEAVSVKQTDVFAAAQSFARVEGILPAPESSHAILVAMQEALKCKEEGREKTILFGLTGTGYFDMKAYQAFNDGKMEDFEPSDEDIARSLSKLPSVPA